MDRRVPRLSLAVLLSSTIARQPGCHAHDSASFALGPVTPTCSEARSESRFLASHTCFTLSGDSRISIESLRSRGRQGQHRTATADHTPPQPTALLGRYAPCATHPLENSLRSSSKPSFTPFTKIARDQRSLGPCERALRAREQTSHGVVARTRARSSARPRRVVIRVYGPTPLRPPQHLISGR